jgi:hypothetical protein
MLVGQDDQGVTDLKLGMADFSARATKRNRSVVPNALL